jgi:2-oxo-4-hydroxy-4-carboxy-5-ureidoimidazoline decarboxylase
MTLEEFNSLADGRAVEELLKVCGSREWARELEASRPYETLEEAIARADEAWDELSRPGRLEAFAAHPRIGDKTGSSWSREEQKGVTDEEILSRLRAKNQQYETRFGHVFLICATGKSAPQILDALNVRLANPPEKEFEIACGEQAKIMRLRMEKLIKP